MTHFAFLQALWFPLLEAMMSPQRKIKDVGEKHYVEGNNLRVDTSEKVMLIL